MYDVRPQILPVICIICLVTFWNVLSSFHGSSFTIFLFVLPFAIFLGSYRFKLKIHDDRLVYQVIILFKVSILKKEIYPNQIKQLNFFEVGWFKKAAAIKLHVGMNMTVCLFCILYFI